jgi:hypothetical protein
MPTPLIEKNAVLATANLLCSMGATQVYLFGSATKGGLRPDSDVDVAVRGLPPEVYFSDVSDGFSPFRTADLHCQICFNSHLTDLFCSSKCAGTHMA